MGGFKIDDIENNFSDDIKRDIVTQNIQYAEIDGIADLIGYNVILFRKTSSSVVSAISLWDINSEYLLNICKIITDNICFPISIGDSYFNMINAFGKDYAVDDVLENILRYHYDIKNEYFVTIETEDNTVVGIEIIYDEEIIDLVRDVRI